MSFEKIEIFDISLKDSEPVLPYKLSIIERPYEQGIMMKQYFKETKE